MHLRKLSMKLRHFDCARVFIALIVCVCPMYGCSAKRSVADQYWHWRGGKQFDRLTTIHFSGAVTDEGVPWSQETWMSARGMYWQREASEQVTTTISESQSVLTAAYSHSCAPGCNVGESSSSNSC